MGDDMKDIFGSDSESDAEPSGQAPGRGQLTAESFDVNKLFEDSEDSEVDAPKPPPKKQRLKKRTAPPAKRAKAGGKGKAAAGASGGDKPRKRPRVEKGASSSSREGAAAEEDGYDSATAVATAEDNAFIASEDELDDLRKEYEDDVQTFSDVDEAMEDNSREGDRKQKKSAKRKSGGKGPDALNKTLNPDNPVTKAVRVIERKRAQDMDEKDKPTIVINLRERMDSARRDDEECVREGVPAQHKLKIVGMVEQILQQRTLHEVLLEYNILESMRDWLLPWPIIDDEGRDVPLARRSLPNLTLRTRMYRLLTLLPVMPEHLKMSDRGGTPGLGKVIMSLFKHPSETMDNKRKLQKLLEEWSRHIFKKSKDYKQLAAIEGPEAADAREASLDRPLLQRQSSSQNVDDLLATITKRDRGMPGEDRDSTHKRVQVPYRDGFHFKVRPQSNVSKVGERDQDEKRVDLLKKIKETKRPVQKNVRASAMSIEGRGAHRI